MAQERTGIIVGTNSGHVRASFPPCQRHPSRLVFCDQVFFRVDSSRGFFVKLSPTQPTTVKESEGHRRNLSDCKERERKRQRLTTIAVEQNFED